MPLRILIADDSATNRLLFSTVMTRLGHVADAVATGREAVALFREARYDVVFLDLNMPVMDGMQTAAEMQRQNPRGIPIYAISGYADEKTIGALQGAGIRRCIQKPLDRQKIDSVLKECGQSAEPPRPGQPLAPYKLLGTYAQELRSRAAACLQNAADRNVAALAREAHTIRALGQMLKTPDVETKAAALEAACKLRQYEQPAQDMHDACMRAAITIERKISAMPATPSSTSSACDAASTG